MEDSALAEVAEQQGEGHHLGNLLAWEVEVVARLVDQFQALAAQGEQTPHLSPALEVVEEPQVESSGFALMG